MVKRASMEEEFVSLTVLGHYNGEDFLFFDDDEELYVFFAKKYCLCIMGILEKSIRRVKRFLKAIGEDEEVEDFLFDLKTHRLNFRRDRFRYEVAERLNFCVFPYYWGNIFYKQIGVNMDLARKRVKEMRTVQANHWMELLSYLHPKYHPAVEEIDWRPNETIPEDFYAL